MKIDKKDLEELYEFVSELFSYTDEDLSESYYWELQGKFDDIKAKIEGESC